MAQNNSNSAFEEILPLDSSFPHHTSQSGYKNPQPVVRNVGIQRIPDKVKGVEKPATSSKRELEEKGLDLRVAAAHQQIRTDRRRLLQCVLNLLTNAVKYTVQGNVTVETQVVQSPGTTLEAGVAEISVTDTGIGIGEEDIGKIFQPFVRLGSPLQATIPGTGLGLYLTRKLAAEVLKGDILLTSEYGKGSRFAIRIPVSMP